jgi:hypothetical protein
MVKQAKDGRRSPDISPSTIYVVMLVEEIKYVLNF